MSPWLSCLHFAYISCMWQNKLDFCFCLCFCYAFSMVLESFSAPYNDRMQIFTKTKDRRAQPVVKYKKSIWDCVNISGRLSPFARQIQDFPEGANLKRGYQTIIQPNFSNNCMKMEKFGERGKHMFKIILCKSATVLCLPMFIFSRAVALIFNWKYFGDWSLVWTTCGWHADDLQMTCRWPTDDTRVRFRMRFHWWMTYVIQNVIWTLAWVAQFHAVLHLVSSACHPQSKELG